MADSKKELMEKIERFLAVLTELAPDIKFGNISLAELGQDRGTMVENRQTIQENKATWEASIDTSDTFDITVERKLELIKNGVIGDPNFGPDSPLYGALGYVRKSERASGLTRKKKTP